MPSERVSCHPVLVWGGLRSAARALLVLAAAFALLLLGASEDALAANSWLPSQQLDRTAGHLNGVSCASAAFCMAAGQSAFLQDHGVRPTVTTTGSNEILALSCAPGTTFCVGVDEAGGATPFTGGVAGPRKSVATAGTDLVSVSCPTIAFCMAVDENNTAYRYDAGLWSAASGGAFGGTGAQAKVACSTAAACVAATAGDGVAAAWWSWNGSTWTSKGAFDADGHGVSGLSCTSPTFCIATDKRGGATRFNGTTWTARAQIDSHGAANPVPTTVFYNACWGTTCVAVDSNGWATATANGTTWSTAQLIQTNSDQDVGFTSVSCGSPTTCVAVTLQGRARTYAPPTTSTGTPVLAGSTLVGSPLTLTHAPSPNPEASIVSDWRSCADATNGFGSNGCATKLAATTSYTTAASDVGRVIKMQEFIGVGLDIETAVASNAIGPITTPATPTPLPTPVASGGGEPSATPNPSANPSTDQPAATPAPVAPAAVAARLAGSLKTTKSGSVTLSVRCDDACSGSASLTVKGVKKALGSAKYTLKAAGKKSLTIKLTAAGKALLKKRHFKLSATLVLTPTGGPATSKSITLKV